jgi:hypothetical protein
LTPSGRKERRRRPKRIPVVQPERGIDVAVRAVELVLADEALPVRTATGVSSPSPNVLAPLARITVSLFKV